MHVCGENTAASSVHWHINPIHLKRSFQHNACKEKDQIILLYGWLNFERRKMFLETVLQTLLICVYLFSCSSTITPSKRCSETCSTGVDERLKFKDSFSFWRFCQVAINMHFVLVGFSAIKYVQHQSETSLRFCCKSLRILSMLSMAVLRVPSSANKSHFTDLGERHRGKLLMKMPNRRGPGIDP